jgi:hypothetical protein
MLTTSGEPLVANIFCEFLKKGANGIIKAQGKMIYDKKAEVKTLVTLSLLQA